MSVEEVFKFWEKSIGGHRALKKKRWVSLKNIIETYKVKTVLEFGSGVSTLLFADMGLSVVSLETDMEYMELVRKLCPETVTFIPWDNKKVFIEGTFDLSLVDGANPRNLQLELAKQHTTLIAIDDYEGGYAAKMRSQLVGYNRVDDKSSWLAVFKKEG